MTTFSDIVDDEIYTPKQVAEALKVPRRRIVDAFRSGELAGIELGPRTIRITGEAVRQWVQTRQSNMNSDSSGNQASSSHMGNGASTSSERGSLPRAVKDTVLASL